MSGFLALEPVWSMSSAGIDCRCKAEHLEYAEARVTGRTTITLCAACKKEQRLLDASIRRADKEIKRLEATRKLREMIRVHGRLV